MSDYVIQTRGITKFYGAKCAVDQVTLNIPRGSVFALLGRNGSGKTTIIRMLMGLLEPTRGSAMVLDEDITSLTPQTRSRVAYVAEGHPLIDWMRIGQLESFQRAFYPGQWNAHVFGAVIEHFGLSPRQRANSLSRGQRAGVSLALALATGPELLVMDDPALGLDPVARRTLLEAMILLTRDAGHTIFFSSHVLNDVERVADHIAILDDSVLRVSATIETFRARVKRLLMTFPGAPPPLPEIPGMLQARREARQIVLTLSNPDEPATHAAIGSLGASATEEIPLSLEDAVIAFLSQRGEQQSLLQRASGRQTAEVDA